MVAPVWLTRVQEIPDIGLFSGGANATPVFEFPTTRTCLGHEERLSATILALFGFDVQIHQSDTPKTNFSGVRPRWDFFYSLNVGAQRRAVSVLLHTRVR